MTTVLCAGVAVIDFVMSLDEMPRRAEKYRAKDAAIVGGGCAANSAVAVARLGGKALLASRLGADAVGDMIIADIESEGVDCRFAKRFEGKRSSFSSVFVDRDGERQIVNFRDETLARDAGWLERAELPHFDSALADTRWPEGAEALMRLARERKKPAIMDVEAPVEIAISALKAASHLAFSEQGLREFSGKADILSGLHYALDFAPEAFVCVTQGEDGVSWLEEGVVRHDAGFRVTVADTLGAGDIWHGAFALALGEGRREAEAIRLANAAAAIKCTRFGGRSGAPTRAEVEEFLREKS
ncbi:sugar kinase [Rhizobiales bacterium]|uniref:PfkB family carbohydrate kinase n=1 Tax=Hongsoonwoonella zoysiae TaxID=2821844 RepID=UPI001560FD6B|nr:PfkB family carbohydrate kinase [Hongsoonwoonella zoysiae]NRG19279.1 sugar kinase [Hongsoonwoonella zoysiae]